MDAMNRYYGFNIRLMKCIGIWPTKSIFRYFQGVFTNIIGMLFVFVQFAALLTGKYEIDVTLTLQTLCFALVLFGNITKYNSFLKNSDAIRYIMDSVQNTWTTVNEEVVDILEKRMKIGKQQSTFFSYIIFPGTILIIANRLVTYIFVKMAPAEANMTDPFPMLTDYFVPHDEYLTLITLHQLITFLLCGTIPWALETVYIMWLQHATSLFDIASHYFSKGINGRPPSTSTKDVNVYRHENFASAVRYQNEGYKFVMFVKNTFRLSYGFLIMLSVVTLAMNVFRVFTALRVTHDMQELYLASTLTFIQIIYIFYMTYVMENVGNHASTISTIVYNEPWYERPIPIQKSILIVMLGTDRQIKFDYYGFYNTTLQSFLGLVKLSASYFMIMVDFQSPE